MDTNTLLAHCTISAFKNAYIYKEKHVQHLYRNKKA